MAKEKETCSICLKEVDTLDKTTTACNHIFHFSCLCDNICLNKRTGNQCPLCRKQFSKTVIPTTSTTEDTDETEPVIVVSRCTCSERGRTYTPFIAGGPCRECLGYESGNITYESGNITDGLWDRNP